MFKVIDKLTFESFLENQHTHELYIRDQEILLTRWSGQANIRICDLTNAGKSGKICQEFGINVNSHIDDYSDIFNLIKSYKFNLRDLFVDIASTGWGDTWETRIWTHNNTKYMISFFPEKAVNVFSPFNLDQYKRLKHRPEKWTVSLGLRALINGQYKNLKKGPVDSVDYPFQLIREMFSQKSSFHFWETSDGKIAIGLAGEYYDFELNIAGSYSNKYYAIFSGGIWALMQFETNVLKNPKRNIPHFTDGSKLVDYMNKNSMELINKSVLIKELRERLTL